MIIVPVILAGGIGERFWPASRSTYPKQLLKLTGSKSMLEKTLDRIAPLCKKPVKPLIITGKNIIPSLKKVLPATTEYDLIVESQGKNTAPAICLAASWIQKKYGDAVMVILSADHEINPVSAFIAAVRTAVKHAAQNDALVTFGITPSRPDTGYGYINIGNALSSSPKAKLYKVKRFVEKPSLDKATEYLKSKSYLWNSGMFVWKTSVILKEFKSSLPDIYDLTIEAEKKKFSKNAVEDFYTNVASISIDYGIMEHASNVYAVAGTFIWDDIGSWEAMCRIHASDSTGTTLAGMNIVSYDCSNSLVFNQTSTAVAAIGLKDISVIVADGVVLIVNRNNLPDLKKYLALIKKSGKLPQQLF